MNDIFWGSGSLEKEGAEWLSGLTQKGLRTCLVLPGFARRAWAVVVSAVHETARRQVAGIALPSGYGGDAAYLLDRAGAKHHHVDCFSKD